MKFVSAINGLWVHLFIFVPIGLTLSLEAPAMTSSYPSNYEESRELFQSGLEFLFEKGLKFDQKMIPVATSSHKNLAIDVVFIPPLRPTKKLLILTSGVHGAEGFTGSAMIFQFLSKILTADQLNDFGVLVVHNINPYGVLNNRRVNENNVDLNRNFLTDLGVFEQKNLGYKNLSSFLNPQDQVSYSIFSKTFFFAKALFELASKGMKALRQAIVGGQTSFAKGVFFRGLAPEEQVSHFGNLLNEFTESFDTILHVDLHTGFGERGRLHFFSTNTLASKADALRELIFRGFALDTGKKEDFYKVAGDITQFTHDHLKTKVVLPMTFEFGTQDSQTTLGSLFSLRSTVLENQGFHYGYASDEAKQNVLRDFSELFNPTDQKWRQAVLRQNQETLAIVLKRFQTEI